MPFIVTTTRPARPGDWHAAMSEAAGIDTDSISRRAVATLEGARAEVFDALTATQDLAEHFGGGAARLSDSIEPGEHITLPDGTVIEVERVGWRDLAHGGAAGSDDAERTAIIAAYNAKQAQS